MKPNAIIVCVQFSDILGITLPRNRHHFDNVLVVSTKEDRDTNDVAYANDALTFCTDAFTRNGADFNKFLALEEGLDVLGRQGWICVLDADILLPKSIPWLDMPPPVGPTVGKLYSPLRRMMEQLPKFTTATNPTTSALLTPFLQEDVWWQYPVHRNIYEWAGYCQIFHASDPHLGSAPWHETNWRHAGGADSFFQRKWEVMDKIRPPFDCLHIGEAGKNWCGRVTPTLDGEILKGAEERLSKLKGYIADRRKYVSHGGDRHRHEKL